MKFDTRQYSKMLDDYNITVIYSGPIWAGGIDGIAEMLLKRLEHDVLPLNASQSVFSVFVEQMNNMMMYSAEKDCQPDLDGNPTETSKGIFILGIQNSAYFIQTGNAVSAKNAEILKNRIDFLNTLNKKELRKFYKEQLNSENNNIESKGAGIGLTEIARRASAPIEYNLEPFNEDLLYFTMYILIQQGGKE